MTMSGYQTFTPAPQRRSGLAVASLVLGLVGLPALALCGAGIVMALVGLVLGGVAMARSANRGLAAGGVAASAVTLVVGGAGIAWLLNQAAECADERRYPDDAAVQRCIEREFPFAKTGSTP